MSRSIAVAGLALGLASSSSGCNEVARRIDFERMIDQPSLEAYEPFPWPSEGQALRRPVPGTVPRERELVSVALDLAEIPIPVDEALLRHGRVRFERLCAACHGILGLGNPGVVPHMALRPPPSLLEPRIQEQPPGLLYSTIRHGYGLMPGYARWLDDRDTWSVVAHMQVLWTSQGTRLADLPPHLAEQAATELEP